MKSEFEHTVAEFICREQLPGPGAKVVVGLSGGADSVCLLAVLTAMGYECVAVHCHFGLRDGEADRDMEHARSVARTLGVEFMAERFDTRAEMRRRGVSAEMAARDLRYALFERVCRQHGCVAVAVAHHREDNVETMMLNLLRGCGLHGVKGMLPLTADGVMRPLLECSRADILAYLQERGLEYVTDSTNLENDFQRNRLRNQVLPVLYSAFPGAEEALTRSLRHLRGCDALYRAMLPERLPSSLDAIRACTAPLTLLHDLLAPYGFNSATCEKILSASSGAEFRSATHRLTVNRGTMQLRSLDAADADDHAPQLTHELIGPEDFHPEPGCLYLDASVLEGDPEWELRRWRTGDRMRPFGMRGTRLLSDIYADARLSAADKSRRWVLTRNGEILWAVGLRASALFPVTDATTSILVIKS